MRVQKSASALTLALLVTSSLAIAVDIPPPAPTTTLAGPSSLSSSSSVGPPSASYTNQVPGSVDAPVDGLDGKPHTGPGLYDTREKGTGSVGISGGKTHVDLKKPPPHTGDHEIVGLDDLDGPGEPSADAKKNKNKKPPVDAAGETPKPEKADGSSSTTSPGGPVPDREHKEYIQPVDTLKDPPIYAPAHLGDSVGLSDADNTGMSQPIHSFGLSFVMIIFSEIGDKTFLIAALMAMKHPRILVFTAALSSLIVMSILSALLGHAVPTLIPKHLTAFLAAALFLVFGVKMIKEGLEMEKGTGNVQHEMEEVEAELQEKSRDRGSSISRKMEAGTLGGARSHSLRRNTSSPSLSDSEEDSSSFRRKTRKMGVIEGIQNLAGLLLSPAWVQTFIMTFLGEWGDRSQIATIAMAAGQDYWYVTIGAISGHAICTGIAVIGGRMLASRISVRNVTFGGAGAFLVFGVLYLVEALYYQ